MAISPPSQNLQPVFPLHQLPPELVSYILETAIKIDERLAAFIPCVCKLWKAHTIEHLFEVRLKVVMRHTAAFHAQKCTAAYGLIDSAKFARNAGRPMTARAILILAKQSTKNFYDPKIKQRTLEALNATEKTLPMDSPSPTCEFVESIRTKYQSDEVDCHPTISCQVDIREERRAALLTKTPQYDPVPMAPKKLRF